MTFNGLDLLGFVLIILVALACYRQARISYRNRRREESRAVVKNLMRAMGRWS